MIFFKIAIVDRGNPIYMKGRLHPTYFIIGLVFIAISLGLYVVDGDSDIFWIMHTGWHAFVMVGAFFAFMGFTRNNKRWYDLKYMYKRMKIKQN